MSALSTRLPCCLHPYLGHGLGGGQAVVPPDVHSRGAPLRWHRPATRLGIAIGALPPAVAVVTSCGQHPTDVPASQGFFTAPNTSPFQPADGARVVHISSRAAVLVPQSLERSGYCPGGVMSVHPPQPLGLYGNLRQAAGSRGIVSSVVMAEKGRLLACIVHVPLVGTGNCWSHLYHSPTAGSQRPETRAVANRSLSHFHYAHFHHPLNRLACRGCPRSRSP